MMRKTKIRTAAIFHCTRPRQTKFCQNKKITQSVTYVYTHTTLYMYKHLPPPPTHTHNTHTSVSWLLCTDDDWLHDSCEGEVLNQQVTVLITHSHSEQTLEVPVAPKHKPSEERKSEWEGNQWVATLNDSLAWFAIEVTWLECSGLRIHPVESIVLSVDG